MRAQAVDPIDLIPPANLGCPRAICPEINLPSPFQVFVLPSGRFLAAWRCCTLDSNGRRKYAGTVRKVRASYDAAVTFCILGED